MSSETEVIGIMNKCGKELEIIFTTPCLSILGMIAEIKRFSHSQISQLMALVDSCLSQLHAELHKTCPALSWENIREMSDFGIEYGLHSHRHIIANDATPVSLIELDYLTAAKIFMAELGKQPTLFAYPNGDYNNDVIQILNRMNINCSVTTEAGYYRDQSPMTIKRILLHNDISSTEDLLNYRLITSVCFNG
jgi:hypothetical protein